MISAQTRFAFVAGENRRTLFRIMPLLFGHDLRANAFRVCREGKPLHTFPDHA
jgi:hypothetical protein